MPETLLLVDGDQYLHRACAAVEVDTRWDDENHTLYSNGEEAWEAFEGSVKKVLAHFASERHLLCFSEGRCFRYDVDPNYKASRVNSRKPLCFHDLKKRAYETWPVKYMDGLEADDVLGILATKPGPMEKIIVARDKDMKTVPAKVWDGEKFSVVTLEEADYNHLIQTLTGDTTDGYKGCPRVGPITAAKLLEADSIDPPWVRVVSAYQKAGLTEEDALRNARLARILRWTDWDSNRKEPILWTPNAKG